MLIVIFYTICKKRSDRKRRINHNRKLYMLEFNDRPNCHEN